MYYNDWATDHLYWQIAWTLDHYTIPMSALFLVLTIAFKPALSYPSYTNSNLSLSLIYILCLSWHWVTRKRNFSDMFAFSWCSTEDTEETLKDK